MSKITLDETLRSKLNGLNEEVEVCNDSGETIGYFLPKNDFLKLLYAWANAQTTDEELDRISREPGGCTLEEIWKRLGVK